MIDRALRESSVVLLSLLAAFGLSLLPMPAFTSSFLPDWVLLAVLYWIIYLPQRVGIGIAWITGLLTDVLTNSLLGEHALASIFVAYLAMKFQRRIKIFSIWQQTLLIAILLGTYRAILFWLQGIIQRPLNNSYWLPIVTGMVIWPLIVVLFSDFQKKWRVESN